MIEPLEPRQFLANVPNANPIVRPDHVVVVVEQDRFNDAIGDVTHMPYTNQLASTGLVFSNSHGVGHPSEVNTLAEYSGQTFNVTDNGGNYTFATQANLASLLNSTQIAPGQFLSFSGFAESLPHDGDMTTVIANDPADPTSPPDLYNRRYNPMAQFLNVGTRNGIAISTAAVNRTFASFPTTAAGFASMPTVSYVIANSVDNGHGSNEQAPYATDPAAYYIHRVNADNWLKNKMDAYLQWAKANNSLLIVTTDEEETDTHPTTAITTIVNGDNRLFVPGVNSSSVNHYNMLRTLTDMYGLSPLGNAASVGAYTTNALGQLAPQASQATSTTVTSSNSSSLWGQDVTFTATVSTASGTPGGTVTFKDGASILGTGTLNALGIATFTPNSPLSVGSHSITASYGGNASFVASTSSALSQSVGQHSTSTTLGNSISASSYGQSVTFTATVTAPIGTPDGSVSFFDGTNLLGTATLDASGSASLATSALIAGDHSVTAAYGGSTQFQSSASSALKQTVAQAATSVTLLSSASPSTAGDSVTFTATVSNNSPGSIAPTGTVNFLEGANVLGSVSIDSTGVAKFTTSALATGPHTITATYAGDTNFTGSTSDPLTQTVNASQPVIAATNTAVASSANPSVTGQSISFAAAVVSANGVGTPTGTVQFLIDGANFGNPVAPANGSATSASISNLAIGGHTISAVYSGDTAFSASAAASITQTVNAAASTTSLGSSLNPSIATQSVTFTAKVTVSAPGAGIPAGTITFKDGTTTLGTATLDATGQAQFTTTTLSVATHSITAVYGGTTSYLTSTSAAVSQQVKGIATPSTVSASDGTFSDRIRITWSAVTTATSYEVWRNTSNNTANATRIAASVTGLTFDDTTAVFGTTYRYWIKARNSLITSGFSTSDTGYRASVNNNFANATVITGTTATVTGSNTGASKESGEPNHAGTAGGKSVWWTWTATASGTVTIDTLGSNFDTLLGIYTGTSVSGLTLVKANDDSPAGGTLTSKVSFTVTAGTTYRIAVDGYGGVSGSITLNLKLV
jgi:hypothetical protein